MAKMVNGLGFLFRKAVFFLLLGLVHALPPPPPIGRSVRSGGDGCLFGVHHSLPFFFLFFFLAIIPAIPSGSWTYKIN